MAKEEGGTDAVYEKEGKALKKDELMHLGPRTETKLQPVLKAIAKFLTTGKGKGKILNIAQIREGAGYSDEEKHEVKLAVHILAHGGVVRLSKIGGGWGTTLVKATGKAYEPGVLGELGEAPKAEPKAKAEAPAKKAAKAVAAPAKKAAKAKPAKEAEESLL